jgi:hypothetical protein
MDLRRGAIGNRNSDNRTNKMLQSVNRKRITNSCVSSLREWIPDEGNVNFKP